MLSAFLADVTEPDRGHISPRRMSKALHMPLSELSRVARLHRNTLSSKPETERVQAHLGEIARIIALASDLIGETGNPGRAIVWFRHQPLSGFDNKTAEQLVGEGHGDAVLVHLNMLANGVHA